MGPTSRFGFNLNALASSLSMSPVGIDAKSNSKTSQNNGNDYFNYGSYNGTTEKIGGTSDSNEAFSEMTIQLNGQDRFFQRTKNIPYFNNDFC